MLFFYQIKKRTNFTLIKLIIKTFFNFVSIQFWQNKIFHLTEKPSRKMRRILLLCIMIVVTLSQTVQVDFPISINTQIKLDEALGNLTIQLEKIGPGSGQNHFQLAVQVNRTYDVLSVVKLELSHYNNVIFGVGDVVDGTKNLIIGSYDTVHGSNNFVFVDKYSGSIDGDLLVGKWRIELDKRYLLPRFVNFVVFPLNDVDNATYGKYLQWRGLNYGTTSTRSTLSLVKQIPLKPQNAQNILSGIAPSISAVAQPMQSMQQVQVQSTTSSPITQQITPTIPQLPAQPQITTQPQLPIQTQPAILNDLPLQSSIPLSFTDPNSSQVFIGTRNLRS